MQKKNNDNNEAKLKYDVKKVNTQKLAIRL